MSWRTRVVLLMLWIVSLVAVREWPADAQGSQPGVEVRFVQSKGRLDTATGVLLANINGQWLPVRLETMPDANGLVGAAR